MTTVSGVVVPVGVTTSPVQISPTSSASAAGISPATQKESNEMYLPNIAYLSLGVVRHYVGIIEGVISSHRADGMNIHGHNDKQAISDLPTYLAALKDQIGKLESGGSPLITGEPSSATVVNLSANGKAQLKEALVTEAKSNIPRSNVDVDAGNKAKPPIAAVVPVSIPASKPTPAVEREERSDVRNIDASASKNSTKSSVASGTVVDLARKNVSQARPAAVVTIDEKREVEESKRSEFAHQAQHVNASSNYAQHVMYSNTGRLIGSEHAALVNKGNTREHAEYEYPRASRREEESHIKRRAATSPAQTSPSKPTSPAGNAPTLPGESNEAYLPNIAYLPLDTVRYYVSFIEGAINNHSFEGRNIHGHYDKQAIADLPTYLSALKEQLGKLESGASPLQAGES